MPHGTPADPDYAGGLTHGLLLGGWTVLKIIWPYLIVLLVIWLFKAAIAQELIRHLRAERTYDQAKFRGNASLQTPPETAALPKCPKCGVAMVLRTARRGPNAGEQFYGCVNFPRCRETMAV